MGYYSDKKKAFDIIDSMLAAGKTIDQIEYKISRRFGFGRKIIEERIELIKKIAE